MSDFVESAKDATNIRHLSDIIEPSDFRPGTRRAVSGFIRPDPAGRSLSNLYTGKRVNPVLYGGVLLAAGFNQAANSRNIMAEGMAFEESESRKMQGLSYAGWNNEMHIDNRKLLTDNMGSDGQLALALHYNRHG